MLAVEIHQRTLTSSDISFDLQLVAKTSADSVSLIRGPYLQQVSPSSFTVRWRTDSLVVGRLRYGPRVGMLDTTIDESEAKSDHEITVTGLQAGSRYYYEVGTLSLALAGNDDEHHLTTAPVVGTREPVRIWAIGDSGTADSSATAVRDAYLGFAGAADTDLWLMLGDNAYGAGTDGEYQEAVFNMYPSFLRSVAVWPTLGNHDGRTASSSMHAGPYYDIFTLPTLGEVGGLASGTEAYYSFDHGNVHVICLDSQDSDREPAGTMATWAG